MALPFMAEYAEITGNYSLYDDIYRQSENVRNLMRDSVTGLYFHGYDEKRLQCWADKKTGLSPEFWLRSMGWFGAGLADLCEIVPENQDGLVFVKNRLSPDTYSPSETVKSDLEIININDEPKKVDIVLALYDGEELCGAKRRPYTLSSGKNTVVTTADFPDNVSADSLSARIYIFNSLEGLNPYTDGYSAEETNSAPSGLALPVRHAKAPYVMTKADGNVNVDGDVSEWDNSLYVHLKKKISGKEGTDVYAAAKYDDKGFYFAFKARDSILTGGMSAKPWLQDSFEVYIDGKDENTAFYQANDIQLVMPYGADGVYCSKQADGTVYKYSETDYGWCAEVFVPYTVIGGLTPEEGSTAGLDFGYNNSDKEGERQGQFMWSGSARNSTSTTAFGTAILS